MKAHFVWVFTVDVDAKSTDDLESLDHAPMDWEGAERAGCWYADEGLSDDRAADLLTVLSDIICD